MSKEVKRIEDANGVTVYQVRSVFVPWSDIAGKRPDNGWSLSLQHNPKTPQMREWLEENCSRTFNIKSGGIWFLEPNDAILFKLTWAGMLK